MKIIDIKKEDFKKYISLENNNISIIREVVSEIIEDIKANGDEALVNYTKKFDNVDISDFKVTIKEIKDSYKDVSDEFIEILKKAIYNIEKFHKNQTVNDFQYNTKNNSVIGQITTPIERVAVYIPGGKAIYPSTVLMNVIPAKIAGVKEIVIITPPDKFGKVNSNILVAADLLNINEIYKIGGAQAVAAVAYGTETIKAVNKIVGPGNIYVAEAKRQVFGIVDIDMIAGPSEILILADEESNPKYIARDLLSQAEHDENAKPYLITNSEKIIIETLKFVEKYIDESKRKEILKICINNNLLIFKVEDVDEMFKISNYIAPEHLELLIKNPMEKLNKITNAGSIFIGEYSPEPVGDYFAGPNHTLPTSGTAKFSSPLGVYDFLKRSSYIKYSKDDFTENWKYISKFAETENLFEHANSIKERMRWIYT